MANRLRRSTIEQFLFEEALVFVLVTDRQGRVLEANSYARQLTGETLVGRSLFDLLIGFPPRRDFDLAIAQQDTRQLFDVAVHNGFPRTLSFRFMDCDDEILVLGEQTHEDNDVLHSNLVTLNNEVSNLNRELQKKNAELERLNELKNRFIGTAVHDLRNPLGAISSLSAALSEDVRQSGSDEQAEMLDAMHESSKFMLSLVDDLLSVATLESGKIRLDLEATELNEVVGRNVRLNRTLASEKGIELVVRPDQSVGEIQVDRAKIQQVLNNLVSNAIKFSPRDSVVSVSVLRGSEEVTVSVEDAGPGIPPEELGKLFKPFSRTSTRPGGGEPSTGLGLYIAKRIVEAHGGTIRVESEPGQGTAFHVSLPLSRSQELET